MSVKSLWHRCFFLLLSLLISLNFTACGHAPASPADPLAYRSQDFCAKVRGEMGGAPFSGTISRETDGEGKVTLTLTLDTPEIMSGVVFSRSGASATVSLGEMRADAGGWSMLSFHRLLSLFTASGGAEEGEASPGSGMRSFRVTGEDGTCVTVLLDAQSGLPRMLESDGVCCEIVSFVYT